MTKVGGKIIDIFNREIYNGEVYINHQKIEQIKRSDTEYNQYILPGFIDAHVHVESSMLVPYEFARIALCHGTVATVSDPHEIANVCGLEGVEYMIKNSREAGLSFFYGAPSCVPATVFETAGACLTADEVGQLLSRDDIWYLSEMMNYPGVLHHDPEVMAKIKHAMECGKPVDGHAPGLSGEAATHYIRQGITTDHECITFEEALWKIKNGMKILIREGSAAKNYNALEPLISMFPDMVMLCSDDKHPDDLLEGHINQLVKMALQKHDLFFVLQAACVNPVLHYNLPTGLLRPGDFADFIVVDNMTDVHILQTYCKGKLLAEKGVCHLPEKEHDIINHFGISPLSVIDIPALEIDDEDFVIQAIDGSLITEKIKKQDCSDNELLQIFVINRYTSSKIHGAFITGFGPLKGAVASSVAHDSHNIVVVGKDKSDILQAVNMVIKNKGGLAFSGLDKVADVPLPVAGLMHILPAVEVGKSYKYIDNLVKEAGCTLTSPFMTLSFMALLVIPKIKMSDLGLFDAENFTFIPKR